MISTQPAEPIDFLGADRFVYVHKHRYSPSLFRHDSRKRRHDEWSHPTQQNDTETRAQCHRGENRDTKVTVIEFNPDPAAPHLNATMTEPYLGLELSYRK